MAWHQLTYPNFYATLMAHSGKVPRIRGGVCVSGVRREGVTRIKRGKCTWDEKGGSVSWLRRGEVSLERKGGSVPGIRSGIVYDIIS